MSRFAHMASPRVWLHILIVRPALRLLFGVSAVGGSNLSGLKQFILIANHNSHLDVLMLLSVLPLEHVARTHPVAAKEYFSRWKPIFWLVDLLLRPIWIVRDERTDDPLKEMKTRLLAGDNIIIFPEGTRGSPGQIERFKTGVGRLAAEYRDVPVVPAFLSGPERAFPRKSAVPLPLWHEVTMGPPQKFSSDRKAITASLEKLVRELSESVKANRHRRRQRRKPAVAVAFLGIDGSGKSTLSRETAKRMSRACLVTDTLEFYEDAQPRDMQPLMTEHLREAVGQYAKSAKSLKHYKVPKLAELLLRDHVSAEAERWYSPETLVLDGSPLLNLAAWAKLYKEEAFNAVACGAALRILSGHRDAAPHDSRVLADFPELAALKRLRLTRMRLPDMVIMLDVDPAISVERITSRGEKRQVHETEEKLAKLREAYLLVCDVVKKEFGIPTLVLEGDQSIEALTDQAHAFVEAYNERIANHG
jgi:1-acyl-sn-glycerol-3-phosphate acyltransferase